MEIRDPIHGSIHILDEEVPIIQHPTLQRLRNIKQLGFSESVFPGATHTRFLHAIGVMCIGEKAFDTLFRSQLSATEFIRLKETFKLACLLHDIGHAPLSHATESAMPPIEDLKIPSKFQLQCSRQANHEDYTIKTIADSDLSSAFNLIEKKFGVDKDCIAELIVGKTTNPDYFTISGVNYFPILHQLISGEMDCDRMDYLLRDSYFCGVSYGNYDLDWLLDNLAPCIIGSSAFLGISERAVVTFDDFLLSRFHMFLMVYFHYRSVCLEQLLLKFFETSPTEYIIPASIEKYIEHDDHMIMKVLKNSSNQYAQAISNNSIPEKIYESFDETQLKSLEQIQAYLQDQKIDYIRCSSAGRLSKDYTFELSKQNYPLKVFRNIPHSTTTQYKNIEDATDLFIKFSKAHAVNRLHCDMSQLSSNQKRNLIKLSST